MGLQDVFYARDKLIKSFNARAKDYHARQQQFELERQNNQGRVELDVNTALQNLKQKGAMALQESEQQFKAPLLEAQAKDIRADTKAKELDLALGKDYSGTLLDLATKQKKLMTETLRKQLGEDSKVMPLLEDTTKGGIAPLEGIEEVFPDVNNTGDLLKYHPNALLSRAKRRGYRTAGAAADSLWDLLKSNKDIF